jgi:hypothetical protein
MGGSASKEEHAADMFNSILEGHDNVTDIKDQLDYLGYENLVCEGGGAKGVAYCGAVRVRHIIMLIVFLFCFFSFCFVAKVYV